MRWISDLGLLLLTGRWRNVVLRIILVWAVTEHMMIAWYTWPGVMTSIWPAVQTWGASPLFTMRYVATTPSGITRLAEMGVNMGCGAPLPGVDSATTRTLTGGPWWRPVRMAVAKYIQLAQSAVTWLIPTSALPPAWPPPLAVPHARTPWWSDLGNVVRFPLIPWKPFWYDNNNLKVNKSDTMN
jgi:hypothetical protein